MTNQSALVEIQGAEIISAEDMRTSFGLVPSGTVEGIATNMVEHWRGKVAGGYMPVTKAQLDQARSNGGFPPEWRKAFDANGNEIIVRPGTKKEQGDLLVPDAIRVTQKTLSRGLNPLAHISIWYQAGQLIDNVNYTILKGMAEQQGECSFEFADMTDEDIQRHGLQAVDIGKVAYLIMDKDKSLLLQATMQFTPELGFAEAKRQALEIISKGIGIGIVRKSEGLYALKGRSLDWTAEKRAGTDAIRRAFGEMTPARIAHYASGQGFIKPADLPVLASPDYQASLPPGDQQFYLEAQRVTQSVKDTAPQELEDIVEGNVALMRENGDDDPIEGADHLPKKMHPSAKFWQYANGRKIDRAVAGKFVQDANGDFGKALVALKQANSE